MTYTIRGQLEIDAERGVIYFHTTDPAAAMRLGGITMLRICSLPTPIPTSQMLDITHMHGVSWHAHEYATVGGNDVCVSCSHVFDPITDAPHG